MWYVKDNENRLTVVSVPVSTLLVAGAMLGLQAIVALIFCGAFRDSSFADFLGAGLFDRGLKLFLLLLPGLFGALFAVLLPPVRTTLDRRARTIAVTKLRPLAFPRRFGFDAVRAEIRRAPEKLVAEKDGMLRFELESGEKIDVSADVPANEARTRAIAALIGAAIGA